VHRQSLQARIRDEAEEQAEHADADAGHEQRPRVDSEEADLAEIRQDQACLAAAGVNRRLSGLLSHGRFGCGRREHDQREHEPLHHDLPVT
jgi:hypothetical protein